ncbi:twin-arginine translocase TatA/TatE family subunit [Flammeovirga kamogawensis]|uniref:Sec-independent protein translocase protein TatA n=1 Tax=Flammeovirga kamogawensis TaxID=373891 RepID=A0ABX8GSR8_9BACT|nr:twin-arginine translocase TatA/TatE family subunit [Flammeovirga kamogawensis]QWG06566.1 twin-arginine translocase TatA/TatE family subunit [Flammeovirga kamogawensis]TRX68392.1 twin-arginine translocase TatA/TatE family subunit [Flammeovirga kamogawensis]
MELNSILLFGMPGGFEWIIIGLVVLLLFGAKRIPELARGLGSGIREFKDAKSQISDEIEKGIKEEEKKEDK